jgi:hypothetical protein
VQWNATCNLSLHYSEIFWLTETLNLAARTKERKWREKISNITLTNQTGISTMYVPNLNLTIYLLDYILTSHCFRTMSVLHYTSFHNIFANVPEQKIALCYIVSHVNRETAVFGKWMLIEAVVHISEPVWKDCLICYWFVEIGRFPFTGLTSHTRILFPVSIMERSGLYFSNI